jgi:predicted phosphodiesterase
MRVAALADIHGNADALRAVMADLAGFAPDLVVNLGDCLSGPCFAGETADILMGAGWPTVRGNHDRWLVEGPGEWEHYALPELTPMHLNWVATLPATLVVEDLFLCHACPQDDLTYWLHGVADGALTQAPLAQVAARAEGLGQSLLLCGHSHVAQAVRLPDGRLVVNPGAVGCPGYEDDHAPVHRVQAGSPHARYALLDRKGADWSETFRMVPYDTGRVVAKARALGAQDWANVMGTGWL